MKSKVLRTITLIVMLTLSSIYTSPVAADEEPPPIVDLGDLIPPENHLDDLGLTTTDFETEDGFVAGESCDAKNGWVGIGTGGQITTTAAFNGSQHLRIIDGQAGCRRTATDYGYKLSMQVAISDQGGAQYMISVGHPDSGNIGQITFMPDGDIQVYDGHDLGDSGSTWIAGGYHSAEIRYEGGNIIYSYNGSQIASFTAWSNQTFNIVDLRVYDSTNSEIVDFDAIVLEQPNAVQIRQFTATPWLKTRNTLLAVAPLLGLLGWGLRRRTA